MEKALRNRKAVIIFCAPALLLFTVVVFYPVFQTFYRSLFNWDGLNKAVFIGIENYRRLLHDKIFYISIKNGLIFAGIITTLQIGIATVLALSVATMRIRGRSILRVSYFIPVVLSITVVCQLWLSMYNGEYGLINKLFEALGFTYRQDWLTGKNTAIVAIAIVNAWQYMGYHFALILAGAKSIPEHYMEAATVDGAGRLRMHMSITIPLMAETYKYCLIFAITGGLNAFSNMYIMTSGGPGNATYTLTYLMYRAAFRVNEYGYGSASAAVLVIECLLFTLLINRFVAREKITY